jgi:hypothetical protein
MDGRHRASCIGGRARMHDITYVGLDVYKAMVCVVSEGTKSAPISEKSWLWRSVSSGLCICRN